MLEKHQAVPMIFRRHGDTTPKNRGHALGDAKPATFYIRELAKQGDFGSTTLDAETNQVGSGQPFAPRFVAFDKKVLRFGAFFLEAVHESNVENYRVRQCEVLYYLEDDTVQITEPKVENSGILQGNFVKRHRVPMPESDARGNLQFFNWTHLNIGVDVTIYGRTFHIVSADVFTRQHLQERGVRVPSDEPVPRDAYTELRAAHMSRETGQDPHAHYGKQQYPMKEFMEATLGKFARPSDHLRRFLDHDRHVLRFFARWDDTPALYGLVHAYTVHFFLADNTIEILESYERNSGCDPFPKLLNRAKLSRRDSRTMLAADGGDVEAADAARAANFVSWEDLAVGQHLDVFGRRILLLDADETTRDWYREHGRPLGAALSVEKSVTPRMPPAPPSHSGIGSEEDSLLSCYHLLPKAPLKSVEELDKTEVLRFRAKFAPHCGKAVAPEDVGRQFVVAVTVSDQSVQICEPPQRNAGFVGGKFLERTRIKRANDASGSYLGLDDFYVGASVIMAGRTFELFEMDEYSANLMETRADQFPRSDKLAVLRKARAQLDPAALARRVDQLGKQRREIDADGLAALLDGLVPSFALHDAITLVRSYGSRDAMKIELEMVRHLLG